MKNFLNIKFKIPMVKGKLRCGMVGDEVCPFRAEELRFGAEGLMTVSKFE
jgi:hypothetical protein